MVDIILHARTLTNGLAALDTECTHVHVCGAGTINGYSDVTTLTLGNKNWGAGNAFGSPGAWTSGRKVSAAAITNGAITANGTVTQWAAVDAPNSRVLAVGALTGGGAVTSGQAFTLGAFDVQMARAPVSAGDPSTIFGANLLTWHKADTGLVKVGGGAPANGDAVDTWADQSGNGITLTGGTLGGLYRPTGLNSLPALEFINSSGNVHMWTGQTAVAINTKQLSVFLVCIVPTTCPNNGRLMCFLNNGDTTDIGSASSCSLLLRDGTTNAFTSYRNGTQSVVQAITTATPQRIGIVFDGNSTKVSPYLNGSKGTDYTGAEAGDTFGATGALAICSQYTSGYGTGPSFGGDMTVSEIVVVKAAATGAEVTSLDNYFKTKWGLS